MVWLCEWVEESWKTRKSERCRLQRCLVYWGNFEVIPAFATFLLELAMKSDVNACILMREFALWRRMLIGFTLMVAWFFSGILSFRTDEFRTAQAAYGSHSEALQGRALGLLAARCLECHSGGESAGGLDLRSREGLDRGGDSGAVWMEEVEQSRLWQVIDSGEMPPKVKLTQEEKGVLLDWVAGGAKLPVEPLNRLELTSDYRAGFDWWAFKPIDKRVVESLESGEVFHGLDSAGGRLTIRNRIDELVYRKLATEGLVPNGSASPRVLIRRLFLDLVGLPPSYEQVQAFERSATEEAYAALVEELLASPAYGERWARHWLDVVRYGESDGFERNFPRLNSWYYRDWVIDALNRDMPYDRFVQMQIAGDQLSEGLEGAAACSFLVSGVHNTVVGSSDRMKRLAIQDELEEKIGTLSQTFLGLTAQCARCHEHKYDPISAESYYQLAAALQGVGHGEREIADANVEERVGELTQRRREVVEGLRELEVRALEGAGKLGSTSEQFKYPIPAYAWNFEGVGLGQHEVLDSVAGLRATLHGNGGVSGGVVLDGQSYWQTDPIDRDMGEKTLAAWVSIDPLDQSGGGVISLQTLDGVVFDAVVYAERESRQWMAGSNGFSRSSSFGGLQEESGVVHIAIRYRQDGTIEAFRNGSLYGKGYKTGFQTYRAGESQFLFGLRHGPAGGNRMFRGVLHRAVCFQTALSDDQLRALAQHREWDWDLREALKALGPEVLAKRDAYRAEIVRLDREIGQVREGSKRKVYTVVSGSGGAGGGIGPTHVLMRGDIDKPGVAVRAGGIVGFGEIAGRDFGLGEQSSDGERRLALAKWITEVNRPLLARVIVNRLWHYHFGNGIVETPNDFGFNGGRPSHPELLDYLAHELMRDGMKLKGLHRRIVMSSVYRQSSEPREDGLAKDGSNRWLWRYPMRRLDGETVRDSMLAISGLLRRDRGGPGYVDVDYKDINGTTYYHPKVEEPAECFRRTVYRFSPRCERVSLLDALDCPDPSATAPKRAMTTTPLQALSLLNSGFMFQMSEGLASELETRRGDIKVEAFVDLMFQRVLLRGPSEEERVRAVRLVRDHGLRALARVLWNTSEFLVME